MRIAKEQDVLLANPVTFTVTPLTVNMALSQGIISEHPPEDEVSPNRAGIPSISLSPSPGHSSTSTASHSSLSPSR